MGYDPRPVWGEDLLRMGDSESYAHIAVNPVESRIQELANPQQRQRKCYILAVLRKVAVSFLNPFTISPGAAEENRDRHDKEHH